ncbi:helix-turn-helix transcriptional regulator [Agathobaculum sp. LCP25S3_E8]
MVGISRRTIKDIEKRSDCRISTARVICNALHCSLDDFYTTDKAEE